MERDELLDLIANADLDEGSVPVLMADLKKLKADDLPDGVAVTPCSKIRGTTIAPMIDDGVLARGETTPTVAVIDRVGYRKYWTAPIGLDEYTALVREAVLARQRGRGDVEFISCDDDGAWIHLAYRIALDLDDLHAAAARAVMVERELHEVAEALAASFQDSLEAATKRLQGWGSQPLDDLVEQMQHGSANERGLRLEELSTRLFSTVPGFSCNGRVSTVTEEIDIRIRNSAMEDRIWSRESALLLAECKNWSTTCGKNEFVTFKDKLRNRSGRVTLGFLISWNGFAKTIEDSMLRGSEGNLVVVPLEGEHLRRAVRDATFAEILEAQHEWSVLR